MTHLSPDLGHANSATSRAPSGGSPRLAVFDLGVLQALIGDEPAIVREFLADFLAAARRQRGGMREAAAIRALGDVRVLAHNLKSSSRSVGAHRLGEACQSLERAATGVDPVAVAAWLQALEAQLALAEAEIIAALDALGGEPQGEMA
jgi:HPt (histidine-containing phosphotransfer) domain-containing protein